MRPEARFSKELVKALEGKGCLVLPIETGPTNRGVPDLYVARKGNSLWVELKVVTPHQQKDPRSAIQIKRQTQMLGAGLTVLNAHDVRDNRDRNVEYRLTDLPHSPLITIFDLAEAIAPFLEN